MSPQAIPYILVLGLLYGTTLTSSSFSVGQFEPSTFIGIRLTLASLAFLIIFLFSIRGHKFPTDRNLWKHGVVLGIFGTAVPMNLIISSLQYLSSGMVGILITLGPVITVTLAHIFLPDEKLNRQKALGVILALIGAVALTLMGESGLPNVSEANPIGYIMIFAAMLSGNSMNIYVRRYMQNMNPMQVSAVRMFVAAAITMPFSLLFVGFDLSRVDTNGWFVLGWAAIFGTFTAILLAFHNIQRFGASTSAIVGYLVPVISSVLGVFLLGETITSGMLGGMAIIVVGVAVLNDKHHKTVVDTPGTD